MGEADLVVLDERRGQGRPHPGARGVALGELVDLAVGALDDLLELALAGLLGLDPGSKAPAAIREATSPACAPPMPSATAKTGARAK